MSWGISGLFLLFSSLFLLLMDELGRSLVSFSFLSFFNFFRLFLFLYILLVISVGLVAAEVVDCWILEWLGNSCIFVVFSQLGFFF